MEQEPQALISIPKRQLPVSENIFQDYSLAVVIDDVAEKMRFDAISLFGIGAALTDGIVKIKMPTHSMLIFPHNF